MAAIQMSRDGGAMMPTIYAFMCGALIFSVALIPPAILIIDKFGF
jgi:hypothetical protein